MSQMSKAAFWNRCRHDRLFFFEKCLRIRVLQSDGSYRMQPFIPNPEQVAVIVWMEEQERANRPVRFIILKARQLGMTTLAMALWFHMGVFKPFVRCQVIAHRAEDTRKIAAIPQLMNDHLPSPVRHRCRARKKGHNLYWSNDSWLEATTQGAEEGGRGDAPTAVHATELSSWDALRVTRTAEEVLQGYFTPVNMVAGTYLGCESTAGMAAGSMYDRFIDAHTGRPGLWKSFFFSWQNVPKYCLGATEEQQQLDAMMKAYWKNGQKEKSIEVASKLGYEKACFDRAIEHDLLAGEVLWTMAKVREMKGDLRRFDQEFPLRWQDAFVAGGRPVFDQYVLGDWNKEAMPDETIVGSHMVEKDGYPDIDVLGSSLTIFRPPIKDHEYIVATDSASGSTDGDHSPAFVFDRHTREFVALQYAKLPPDELAEQAVLLARWYNNAYLIPEINNHGYATVRRIMDLGYPMHRRHPGREMVPGSKWSDNLGFMTTRANRQMIIDLLSECVRTRSITTWSKEFISEMRTFVYDTSGKADHMGGRHSDAIICAGLCLYADQILRPPRDLVEPDDNKAVGSILERKRQQNRKDVLTKKRDKHPRLGTFV